MNPLLAFNAINLHQNHYHQEFSPMLFVVEAFLDTDCRNVTCNSSHLNCKLIQTRDFYNPIAQKNSHKAALHFGAVTNTNCVHILADVIIQSMMLKEVLQLQRKKF